MKKTVLALAAIAASSAAFAQSSVTLYGVVDASIESVKTNDKTVNRVSSDNLASSRLAFKGVEDLGGGLKATFLLDSGFSVDTGANSTLFGRSAYVGLAGGFGEVRLGRQDSLIGAQTAAILGTQAYDEGKIATTLGGETYRRLDNAITYIAPTLVPGLSLSAQFSTRASGAETYGDNTGRAYGFAAAYANGPLSAGLSYIKANTDVAGDVEDTGVLVYGAYDFGVAKLTGYYNTDDRDGNFDDRDVFGFKVAAPVAANVTVTGGFAQVRGALSKNFQAKGTKDDKANIFTLKAQYDLSKRTALYALFTQVNNDNNSDLAIGAASNIADKSSRGLALGVRHSF